MPGLFITLEGTEGSGKSTQLRILAERIRAGGRTVLELREPGGTPIGEEIRHTLKHSPHNHGMTPEAELLLMTAARAQLVREVIRPALSRGEVVLCDRFFDSTIVYQGHGRGLGLPTIHMLTEFAVGETVPDLTLLLLVPVATSEARRAARQTSAPGNTSTRDRFEEADRAFFERVEAGYREIARSEPGRIQTIDGTTGISEVTGAIWKKVEPLLG